MPLNTFTPDTKRGSPFAGEYLRLSDTPLQTSLFGSVWLAMHIATQRRVVIKQSDKEAALCGLSRGRRVPEDVVGESSIHRRVTGHPNVCALVDCFDDGQYLYSVLEYCSGGDLLATVQRVPMAADAAADLFVQLLRGVQQLHAHDVCHRDLSLENVLLTGDAFLPELKICDFGLAAVCPRGKCVRGAVGKDIYLAPECASSPDCAYDPRAADVWQCGIILFALLTSSVPYANSRPRPGEVEEVSGRIRAVLKKRRYVPLTDDAIDLLDRLLCPAEQRLRVDEIFAHPFLKRASGASLIASVPSSSCSVSSAPSSPASVASTSCSAAVVTVANAPRDESAVAMAMVGAGAGPGEDTNMVQWKASS